MYVVPSSQYPVSKLPQGGLRQGGALGVSGTNQHARGSANVEPPAPGFEMVRCLTLFFRLRAAT